MVNDFACWVRILRRNPAYLAVTLLTLALGIGVTTAILSVANSVLLRPLPFPEPDRLALVWEETGSNEQAMFSVPDYLDLRAGLRSFEQIAANWGTDLETQGVCSLAAGTTPEPVPCATVSYNFFAALGVKPLLGRDFEERDERQSLAQVATISHAFWQRRFGGDPGVIGKHVKVDGAAVVITGILPAMFAVPSHCDLWQPGTFDAEWRSEKRRGLRYLRLFARLKSGVRFEYAQAEFDAAAQQLPLQRQSRITKRIGQLVPLQDVLVRDSRSGILALLAAAIVLLLIACSNVANLSLAVAAGRGKEWAVRAAVGASPARLLRQSLLESLALSLSAGILGALAARALLKVLAALAPVYVPRLEEAVLSGQVLVFTLLLALLTAGLCGLAPAAIAARFHPRVALAEGGRGAGGGHQGAASVLVVAEVALAVLAAAGAALVWHSFANLRRLHPGFEAQHVLTARLLPDVSAPDIAINRYLKEILERVRSLPGVVEAAIAVELPLTGWRQELRFVLSPGLANDPGAVHSATLHQVSRGYFRAMGIPLARGRDFLPEEEDARSPRVIVNEELARRFFPGRDPVGQGIFGLRAKARMEIVGVVGNVRHRKLWDPPEPEVYAAGLAPYVLILRGTTEALALAPAIRATVNEIDRNQPVADFKTLREVLDAASGRHRFWALLLGVLAGASLSLAAAGVYGVVAGLVQRRLPEFALRAAVGARPVDIIRFVLSRTLKLAGAGALAGILAALVMGRMLASLLFEVSPTDPFTLGATVLVVMFIALVAAYLPARSAARAHPASLLRLN